MIALGSDHAGFPLKTELKNYLDSIGVEYKDFGCFTPERFDYAIAACESLLICGSQRREMRIMRFYCCGTGIGMSMAANKV
jgi:ribose 5-phosphate isomerase B